MSKESKNELAYSKNELPITNEVNSTAHIENLIMDIRGCQVMLDRDLANLYGVDTKVLNQAVKRNIERFPAHFRFQLTDLEKNKLVTICDRLQILKHSNVNPFVFTEQGVAMLSTVLRSKTAVSVSIQIMDAFTAMRHFIASNAQIFQRLDVMEQNRQRHLQRYNETVWVNQQQIAVSIFGLIFYNFCFNKYSLFFSGQ